MQQDNDRTLALADSLITIGAHALYELPGFGLYCLSVWEAANLVAAQRWFNGDSAVSIPDDGELHDWRSCRFQQYLYPDAQKIGVQIMTSIDKGELKTCKIVRDMEGGISPWETVIKISRLERWAESRGITLGDVFSEYNDQESTLYIRIAEEVSKWRALQALDQRPPKTTPVDIDIETASEEELRDALRTTLAALYSLESTPSTTVADPEPTPKRKRSLLAVIGGLLLGADLDPNKRGTAAKMEMLTEKFGHPVGHDTVTKILEEVRGLRPGVRR